MIKNGKLPLSKKDLASALAKTFKKMRAKGFEVVEFPEKELLKWKRDELEYHYVNYATTWGEGLLGEQ